MAYADYEFYTTSYFGNVVPESDFPRLSERASEKIDGMTNDRLSDTSWLTEKQMEKVKKACCAMTESLYYSETLVKSGMDSIGQTDGHSKVVSSVSSGSESISYATGGVSASSLEGEAIHSMIHDKMQDAVSYLSGVLYKDNGYSILFRGVGYE